MLAWSVAVHLRGPSEGNLLHPRIDVNVLEI